MNHLTRVLFCFFLYVSFSFVADDYEQWYQKRIESLKSEDGWLNLVGLFWLSEGENTFGSDENNSIVFPKNAPPKLGTLTLHEGKVSLKIDESAKIQLLRSETIPEYVFADGRTTTMQHGSLRWFIIKRGSKYGVRLRDLNSPQLTHFKGIDRFKASNDWKIKATFEKPKIARTITITDIVGTVSQQPLLGHAVFNYKGKTYRLAATDGGDDKLFIIFKDKTAGHETYGAGRFLYPQKPNEKGEVVLDFNKAINPPCAFSPFATCPLPPAENRLPIRIEAGEKDAEMH